MLETILLFPSADATALLRSLAGQDRSRLGLVVLQPPELALRMLDTAGIVYPGRILSRSDLTAMVYSIVKEGRISYFAQASYADAGEIVTALDTLRNLIPEEEEAGLERYFTSAGFPEKKAALHLVWKELRKRFDELGAGDATDLLRYACKYGTAVSAEIYLGKEFPCTPLEESLAAIAGGGEYKETNLSCLFGTGDSCQPREVLEVTEAYGAGNEVEHILSEIFEKQRPLDQVVVATATLHPYDQLFYEYAAKDQIPVSFGDGVPVRNANPARLLRRLLFFLGDGCCGTDALRSLVQDGAFDRTVWEEAMGNSPKEDLEEEMLRLAGRLRLGLNSEENEEKLLQLETAIAEKTEKDRKRLLLVLQKVRRAFAVMACPETEFLRKFTKIREGAGGELDKAALQHFLAEATSAARYAPSVPGAVTAALEQALNDNVHMESSREGALHLCTLPGALSTVRDTLFAAGLAADVFPGRARENAYLTDRELEAFPGGISSTSMVARKNGTLCNLVSLYGGLQAEMYFSYPVFRVPELKRVNPSSAVSVLAPEAPRRFTSYFDSALSSLSEIGKAYRQGGEGKGREPGEETIPVYSSAVMDFSPSAIGTFFSCPRQFYLRYILNIPEPDPENPYEVMDARDFGTVAHAAFEKITPDMTAEQMRQEAERQLDAFFASRPPLSPRAEEPLRRQFMEMADRMLDMDPGNEPIFREQRLSASHPCGVSIHGYPDRVEQTPDGKVIIADYKTGREVHHTEGDVKSCLQALLYAWLYEMVQGRKAEHVEFRYPRAGTVICCLYNETTRQEMDHYLQEFAGALKEGKFPPCGDCSKNPYCKYGSLCAGIDREEEET